MSSNIKFDDYSSDDVIGIESRYVLDGAASLMEAADLARSFADYLEALEAEGYELTDIITKGKGRVSQDVSELQNTLF